MDFRSVTHYVDHSCEYIRKNRSQQWRYKLKMIFEKALSEDVARKIEVSELTPENWNRLCNMWSNLEHKVLYIYYVLKMCLIYLYFCFHGRNNVKKTRSTDLNKNISILWGQKHL